MKKKKYNKIKEVKRSARDVIGRPSKGKKVGAHKDLYKEGNKNKCRELSDEDWIEVEAVTVPNYHEIRFSDTSWHNWSGWPGAWCLDCGVEDQLEICLADCPNAPYPPAPGEIKPSPCPIHKNGPCLEKGKGLFNPYLKK